MPANTLNASGQPATGRQGVDARRIGSLLPRLLGGLILTLTAGCETGYTPTMTFDSLVIQGLSLDSVSFLATYQVRNSTVGAIQLNEVRWTLASESETLYKGEVLKPTEITPGRAVPVQLHGELTFAQLRRAGLDKARQFTYTLAGQANFQTPFGSVSVPFESAGPMPVFHPVQVDLVNVQSLGVSQTKLGIELELAVFNPNSIWLKPDLLDGQLVINERPLIELRSNLANVPKVGPRQTVKMRLPIWTTSAEVGLKSLSDMVTAPGARFQLIGTLSFRLPGSGDTVELLGPAASEPD